MSEPAAPTADTAGSLFDDLEVRAQFSPVCRLSDGSQVAVEMQLGGPQGSRVETPWALHRAARIMQQHRTFDRRKRALADQPEARAMAESAPVVVCVDLDLPTDRTADQLSAAQNEVLMVLPSALDADPSGTLAAVARARSEGNLVGVDGLTNATEAATLLCLLEPDIVRLGPELLACDPGDLARISYVLAAHAERLGPMMIADGVGTEADRRSALRLGADYGVGALYPPVASSQPPGPTSRLPVLPVPSTPAPDGGRTTPFAIAAAAHSHRRADRRTLQRLGRIVEDQASAGDTATIVRTLDRPEEFTAADAERWAALSLRCGVTGLHGAPVTDMTAGRVRQIPGADGDPLSGEWGLAILGAHTATLLTARPADSGDDVDYIQTHDRTVVTQAVRCILSRFP